MPSSDKYLNDFRRIRFLHAMEGTYKKENHGLFFEKPGNVRVVLIFVGDLSAIEMVPWVQRVQHILHSHYCHVFLYNKYITVVFENETEETIGSVLENIYGRLKKHGALPAITLGSLRREASTDPGLGVRQSCLEAESLMEKIFFFHDVKYLRLKDVKIEEKVMPCPEIDLMAGELASYIQVVDDKKIRSFFGELESAFFTSGKNHLEVRQECMLLMMEVRNGLFRKVPELKEELGTGMEIFDAIMKQRYLKDVINSMTETCLCMTKSLPLFSVNAKMQRIINYVNDNYSEDLRLSSLAELFYYNSAYLGKCFRKHKGMSFLEYLDTLRINAAKEMLETTNMKVYEVSVSVGYGNTDLFYSKFRKYTGKSPLAFRKKINHC